MSEPRRPRHPSEPAPRRGHGDHEEHEEHEEHEQGGHEEREDLVDHRRGLALAGVVVGGLVTVGFLITWLSVSLLQPSPRAAVDPFVDVEARILRGGAPLVNAELPALRRAVEAGWALEANTYARRGDGAEYARIPVERAAELLLERGFPARAAAAGPREEDRRGR